MTFENAKHTSTKPPFTGGTGGTGNAPAWDLHSPSEESTESLLEEPSHYLSNLQQTSPCLISGKI